MSENVSLLLITCDRSHYLDKTLRNLLSHKQPFQLYIWDNGSGDDSRGLIADAKDERIVQKHYHKSNVNQSVPVQWFLQNATTKFVGKIDDDILLPDGWTEVIETAISSSDRLGMIGCWVYMPEDYVPDLAIQNTSDVNGFDILRCTTIAGHSFLSRRELLLKYLLTRSKGHGIPIDRIRMTLDHYVSGCVLPLVYAHNMDDPRSPHYFHKSDSSFGTQSSLTARKLGFKTTLDFARWIKADAIQRQAVAWDTQFAALRLNDFRSTFLGTQLRRIEGYLMKCRDLMLRRSES